jgi:hypothetical protein
LQGLIKTNCDLEEQEWEEGEEQEMEIHTTNTIAKCPKDACKRLS